MKKFSLLLIAINIAIISFAEGKTAYGILAFDEEEVRKINSLVSFPLEGNFTTYEQIVQFGKTDVFSGALPKDHTMRSLSGIPEMWKFPTLYSKSTLPLANI